MPKKVYIDKSGANLSGIKDVQTEIDSSILIDQSKYMNNRIEADHRKIKQRCRSTLWFKSFSSAAKTINMFEVWQMFRKDQIDAEGNTSVENFYALFA